MNLSVLVLYYHKQISNETTCFASSLSNKLGDVTIIQKGMIDVIAKGETVTRVTEEGSLRRCGGQGDVVAGVMGVMNLWSTRTVMDMPSGVVAATATSQIIRRAASRAFAKEQRGMTAMSIVA